VIRCTGRNSNFNKIDNGSNNSICVDNNQGGNANQGMPNFAHGNRTGHQAHTQQNPNNFSFSNFNQGFNPVPNVGSFGNSSSNYSISINNNFSGKILNLKNISYKE
jgi:hypothetical protein